MATLTSTFRKLPEQRQTAILDAAASIFAAVGYAQANVADICGAAGISNGALYKYFGSKRAIFEAVARRMNDLMMRRVQRLNDTSSSIWAVLRQLLYEAVLFVHEHRDYSAIYMDLGSPSMSSFASTLSDELEGWSMQFYCALIERAKEARELRGDIDTATVAYVLDNHLMLFSFSLISEHYNRRLHAYLGAGREAMSDQEKVDRLMAAYRQLLAHP